MTTAGAVPLRPLALVFITPMCVLPLVLTAEPGTSLKTIALVSWVLPSLAAIVVALALWRYSYVSRRQADPTTPEWRRWMARSMLERSALRAFSWTVLSLFAWMSVRDGLRLVGAEMGGDMHSINAVVRATEYTSGARNPCKAKATFDLAGGDRVELCIQHTIWSELSDDTLAPLEHVILVVKSNAIGSSVVRIVRHRPAAS